MAAENSTNIDLDEDLFDFEPIGTTADELEDEEADLDEIFASFQAEEEKHEEPSALPTSAGGDGFEDLDDDEDDIYGDLSETETSAPAALTPAPAPDSAATPEPVPADEPEIAAVAPEPAPKNRVRKLLSAASGGGALSRSALWILLAAMSLNGLVAIVMVSSTGQLRNQMNDISVDVEETIREIRSEYWGQRALLLDETTPIAAPDPENHPAFTRALSEIENGEYSAARQRLYALLAVVDRLDRTIRQKVEARASYLIGHAWHLEALRRLESEELGGNQQ